MLPSVFVDEAPRVLIAKTKSNQSQGREAILLNVLHSCLMSRYQWEGQCLRIESSTFKPCHIICLLGSALDNVDGVKAVSLKPTFRLGQSQSGKGASRVKFHGMLGSWKRVKVLVVVGLVVDDGHINPRMFGTSTYSKCVSKNL